MSGIGIFILLISKNIIGVAFDFRTAVLARLGSAEPADIVGVVVDENVATITEGRGLGWDREGRIRLSGWEVG